jgi:hypothetical protein
LFRGRCVCVWSEPENFVDEVMARFVIRTAKSLTKQYSFSDREVETVG